MGKKSRKEKQAEQQAAPQPKANLGSNNNNKTVQLWQGLIIFLVACLLYANTVPNKFAVDDTIVITGNQLTKQGVEGIPKIMTTDAFYGFFGENYQFVAGGRYRPLSLVTFAIEYELFQDPNNNNMTGLAHIMHFNNVWLYGLTCLLVFLVLVNVLKTPKLSKLALTVPFVAALIFAAHPIHTEVVANIKGRDEIMGMLGAVLTLYLMIKFVQKDNFLYLVGGLAAWVFALFSKENAITFLAVIPLTYWFFTKAKVKHFVLAIVPMLVLTGIYLYLRSTFTPVEFGAESREVLNNPFVGATLAERFATVSYTFLEYIKLLIFPHPLTYDYYYNQVPIVGWSNPQAILSLLITLGLVGYGLYGIKTKNPIAYGILFYYITLSIVSNILFTVGIAMNERFVFMPSLGFALIAAILLVKLTNYVKEKNWQYKTITNPQMLGLLLGVILLGYSIKTITRNDDWKDDYTLFSIDSKNSPNSAKGHNAFGGELVTGAEREKDPAKKKAMLEEAVVELERALEIYPNYLNAWLLLGNAKYKLNNDPKEAEKYYLKTLSLKPEYFEGNFNLGAVYLEHDQPAKAIPYLKQAIATKPEKIEAYYNLADAYYKSNQGEEAIKVYQQIMQVRPNSSHPVYKIGTVYGRLLGNLDEAIKWFNKAISMDPNEVIYYEDLSVAYGFKGDFTNAIQAAEKGLQIDPNYAAFYRNIAIGYEQLGDKAKAEEYMAMFQQKSAQ